MSLRKRTMILIVVVMLLLGVSVPVFADFGPKPSITIFVEDPPKEDYYLDLLIPDFAGEPYSNIYEDEKLDEVLLEMLRNDPVEGWHAALTVGTQVPLFGKLTGDPSNGGMEHTFSYFGTPKLYRIFIVTKSGKTFLSEPIEKVVFQERLTVKPREGTISESKEREGTPYPEDTGDLIPPSIEPMETTAGTITLVDRPNVAILYLGQFALTFFPTLILEFLVLMLFRIPIKKNLFAFVGVNLVTQVLLTVVMTGRLIASGVMGAYGIFVPLEILILGIECILYLIFMRDVRKRRRILYAVVANAVSAIAGFLMTGAADRLMFH